MLEFNNVSKSFWTGTQRKVILDRISFRVELGTSLGILAPNGTGKTTLIKMMAGLEKPDEGVINRYCNVSFPLGFMGGVVNRHSAQENCRYIAKLYGLDPDYVEAYCRWLCNLDEYFNQPLGVYSSGMRARFTFSLMLALDFDIYLIDEGMPNSTDVSFNKRLGISWPSGCGQRQLSSYHIRQKRLSNMQSRPLFFCLGNCICSIA